MKISKAYEIRDAKISFVSLVDKAANKRTFLITKAVDGEANFMTNCKILKSDEEFHYVTGIVYEPMTEDAHGNYMTEAEIAKAAYEFAKNRGQIDIQHNYKPLKSANVIESYIAKCDMEIGGEAIKKGSWLMTVEVDNKTFEKVQKGELTGFSMGGVGKYSTVDVELPNEEEKGLIAKIAEKLGIGKDTEKVEKAGRKISAKRLSYLKDIQSKVNELIAEVDDENKEAEEMNNEEITKAIADAVEKAIKPINESLEKITKSMETVEVGIEVSEGQDSEIKKTVDEAIEKAMKPIAEKLDAIAKARGESTNLNNEQEHINKEDKHYMTGMF